MQKTDKTLPHNISTVYNLRNDEIVKFLNSCIPTDNPRFELRALTKLLKTKGDWILYKENEVIMAIAFLASNVLGVNDTYILEFQTIKKGYGKALLNVILDHYTNVWLLSYIEASDSLLEYYQQFKLNEFVLEHCEFGGDSTAHFFYQESFDKAVFEKIITDKYQLKG